MEESLPNFRIGFTRLPSRNRFRLYHVQSGQLNVTQPNTKLLNDSPEKKTIIMSAISRREMLGFIGTAAAGLVAWGCGRSQAAIQAQAAELTIAKIPSCVVRPQQTEGPFFVDEKLNRADIRSDPSDGSVKQGMPLRLGFQISRIDRSACAPLSGAV